MIEIYRDQHYINTVAGKSELRQWIINNVAPSNPSQDRISDTATQYEAESIARQKGYTFKTINPKNNDKQTL